MYLVLLNESLVYKELHFSTIVSLQESEIYSAEVAAILFFYAHNKQIILISFVLIELRETQSDY